MIAKLALQTLEVLVDITLFCFLLLMVKASVNQNNSFKDADLQELIRSLYNVANALLAVTCLLVVSSLSNAAYLLWITSLDIETFLNERGNFRKWKNMNDTELLKDLLTYSGVESGSEVEERGTIL
jgi:hypothetical protein